MKNGRLILILLFIFLFSLLMACSNMFFPEKDNCGDMGAPGVTYTIAVIYDTAHPVYVTTPLEDLKGHLTVTVHYSDGSEQTLQADEYEISGALTEGTSSITVSYGGATSVFDITVLPAPDYGVSLSAIVSFPDAVYGYGAQTGEDARVTNIGLNPTGDLVIALDDDTAFDLSDTMLASIASGGRGFFTVTPKTGLGGGTYTATVTVSNTGNGIEEEFTVSFTVTKAEGAAVSSPTAASTTLTSITLNAVTAGNGQTVEYSISANAAAPANDGDWQTDTAFTGLTAGTTYYFFARAKADGNYTTGAASSGTAISTKQQTGIIEYWAEDDGEISIANEGGAPIPNNIVELQYGDSITFAAGESGYTGHSWTVSGVVVGTDSEFTFDTTAWLKGSEYVIGLSVLKDGRYYFTQITVKIL